QSVERAHRSVGEAVHDVQPKSLTVKAPEDSPAALRPEIKGEKSLVHAPRSAVRKIFAGNKKAEIIVPPQRRFCRNLRRPQARSRQFQFFVGKSAPERLNQTPAH